MAGTNAPKNDDGKNDDGEAPDTGTGTGKPNDDNEDPDDADADKWKAMARKHEREAKKARDEADQLRQASATDAEKAIDKARKEAREEALAEALSDRIDDAIESAASGKLAKPGHVRLLDVDDRVEAFSTADGGVDRKAIDKAIDKLVKENPELGKEGSEPMPLVGGGKNPTGAPSADSATREFVGNVFGRNK